ncbi:MAG: DNA translocase FtsK 4TM domain-containing protein [Burkholderiaceae bacterium]|nr:DNA translocase FtsK 4TM domain-containing protein [Burkholderiaceae bacterium]
MNYSLHSLNDFPIVGKSALRAGIVRFGHELVLLVGLALLAIWSLALYSYSPQDPAWSTSGAMQATGVRNWLGRPGAWLADASYFALGFSVWWCLAAGVRAWLASLVHYWMSGKGQPDDDDDSGSYLLAQRALWLLGLVLLLCASTGLEWSRLYQFESRLPGHSGGVLGYVIGPLGMKWLGFNGSGLLAFALAVLGAALVFHFSWSRLAEVLGRSMDAVVQLFRFQREVSKDVAEGKRAARKREEVVQGERSEIEAQHSQHPLQIFEPVLDETPFVPPPPAPAPPAAQRSAPTRTPAPMPATPPVPDTAGLPPQTTATQTPAQSLSTAPEDEHDGDDLRSYLPPVALLDSPIRYQEGVASETLEMTSRLIEKKLRDFGVEVRVAAAMPGPIITRYEIEPAPGVNHSQIVELAKELARSLSLPSIRVIETIAGKNLMALELPNAKRHIIRLSEILSSQIYHQSTSLLTLGLGKDIVGNPVVADLAKMQHVLVAGTTGAGKSIGLHSMILSLLYKAPARDVRLLIVDTKLRQMSVYAGISHLLAPVITEMQQAINSLHWCASEMEQRYKLMGRLGVRNLAGYNAKIDQVAALDECIYNPFSATPEAPEPLDRLAHIVVVIDELAELMLAAGKQAEELIARLAQKARGAGIHLILATERPSVEVITGLIKANIPTRIAFQASSKTDSRTILDQTGAEALLGIGDMLYMTGSTGEPIRVHGAFVSDAEISRVVSYLRGGGKPSYVEGVTEGRPHLMPAPAFDDGDGALGQSYSADAGHEGIHQDPVYEQAVQVVLQDRQATPAHVQRQLRVSYDQAVHLLQEMEYAGLVSAPTSTGQREVLVPWGHW